MPINNELKLNIEPMDTIHNEFEIILQEMKNTRNTTRFMELFVQMIEHTKHHFKTEEDIMNAYNFYDKKEHFDEHDNLLSEMQYFYEKAQRLPMFGKSYINEYAYDKFKRHIINIDSQLAMFLKNSNYKG